MFRLMSRSECQGCLCIVGRTHVRATHFPAQVRYDEMASRQIVGIVQADSEVSSLSFGPTRSYAPCGTLDLLSINEDI